jgi:hypothetical protein
MDPDEDMKGSGSSRCGVLAPNSMGFCSDLATKCQTLIQEPQLKTSHEMAQIDCKELLAHSNITQ